VLNEFARLGDHSKQFADFLSEKVVRAKCVVTLG